MSQRFLASCLRIEIDGATKQWLESRPAMSVACEKLDSMIDDVIRRYGATRNERLERGAILAFIDPLASIEAASALIYMVSKETWTTRAPLRIKVAVRTGMIESRRTGVGGEIVELCAMQLARTFAGQATICETTRNLVAKELPPDIDVDDLGRVQVDPDRPPERVFALRVAGVQSEANLSQVSSGGNHNIPVRLTSFIGREADIENLERRLRSDRLLTIVGPGGSGKTSLSREIARHFALEFTDGAWFVPLAEVTDEPGVYRSVQNALREVLPPSAVGADSIFNEIGAKSFLLVLDNLEQVLRPASRFIHKLLTFCPNVRVLATSRHNIGAAGEQVYPVRPFATDALKGNSDLRSLIENSAVRLFVDRARAVDPEFSLTKSNASIVVSICRKVEGLPLAIEHVASNVGKLSIDQIGKTLDDSLLAFRLPENSVEKRHETMRATVKWSTELLSEDARSLSSVLLVFSGGWTLETCCEIAKITGIDEKRAFDAHGELVEGSIVARQVGAGATHYRFPEAVKEALLELMHPSDSAISAHANYYFELANASDSALIGAEQSEWIRRLEAENENLRSALKHFWEFDIERAPDFVSAMRRFWLRSRQHNEATYWFENALSVVSPDRAELQATLLNALGACHFRVGEPAKAERYYQESRKIWERLGVNSELGALCTNLAMCKIEQSDVGAALTLSEASCRHYELAHDERGLGSALMNLGYFQAQLGDFEGADASLTNAVHLLEACKHESHLCLAIANQSYVAWKVGSRDSYHRLVQKQLDLIERSHDATSLSALVLGLAACATEAGQTETVRASIEALHSILGPNPKFSSRLHGEQYQRALLASGQPDIGGQKTPSDVVDWADAIESVRAISIEFSTVY